MSTVVGGVMTVHSPSIMSVDQGRRWDEPQWQPLLEGFSAIQEWLDTAQPDLLVIVTNDHVSHFGLRTGWPTFAVAAATQYPLADEGKGVRNLPPIPGDQQFALALSEELVDRGIDLTICHEYSADHGVHSPLPLINGQWKWPVVIVHLNTIFRPFPSTERCWTFGEALGDGIRALPFDRRVVVVGLGGMSHELTGPRFGFVGAEWDRACMDMLEHEPRRLTGFSADQIAERGGSEGVEILHWLAVRAAAGPEAALRVRFYYPHHRMGYGGMVFAAQK